MKMLTLLVIAQFGSGWVLYPPSSSAQQILGEPSAALKVCIAGNAAGVEQAITSLDEGVNFLVQKICAAPLAEQVAAQQAEQRKKMAAAQKSRTDAVCKTLEAPTSSAATRNDDQDRLEASYMQQMCNPAMRALTEGDDVGLFIVGVGVAGGNSVLDVPGATSLAAQTLLKLRTERTKPR